jgi:ABC-type bacteriocin/lantibiotic exporter with double-glycine peptidase domain
MRPKFRTAITKLVCRRYRQHTRNDCGTWALKYLLFLAHVFAKAAQIEAVTKPDMCGTSPDKIGVFLRLLGLNYWVSFERTVRNINLPALVDWQKDGQGHWSVAIEIVGSNLILFDPEEGKAVSMSVNKFDRAWFSKMYGKHVGITLI